MFETVCFFSSDLHGSMDRYQKLFKAIEDEKPHALFLGGDLLPSRLGRGSADFQGDFIEDFLFVQFQRLKSILQEHYPAVFLILGNDDGRFDELKFAKADELGLWHYAHARQIAFQSWNVYGYSYIPPTPFRLKDWEKYDVSRFVDPGSISPEEGVRTVAVREAEQRYATIKEDIEILTSGKDVSQSIFLFHAPPYQSMLDRAALDGKMVDFVPLDVHVGSIAIQRFIKSRQPLMTLHGHIHESARLTGHWKQQTGRTWSFSAAHDGRELALVRFDPSCPEKAERDLL